MNATENEKKKDYLKNEIVAFENRLESIKSELSSLGARKEAALKEMENYRNVFNSEIEKKHLETRQARAKVEEERAKLETDKKEFEAILNAHKREQAAVAREKEEAANIKKNFTDMRARIDSFVVGVRREYEKL